MIISKDDDLRQAIEAGLAEVGEGAIVEHGVELCHPTRAGITDTVHIGPGAHVRSGTIIYSGVRLGAGSATGHHVVIRENTTVGERSVLGTGVKVEMNATIGDHVLIETQSHVTAHITIEDYVFFGVGVVTTNDERMLHRRAGAGEHLDGPTVRYGARIGSGAILLPGVEIGREAIVAAGALVNRDIPERAVAAGSPARVLGAAPDDEPIIEG